MRVAIIGKGVEGNSARRYWIDQGAEAEMRSEDDGHDYLEGLGEFDLVVRSPSVRPEKLASARRVTSVTNEFFRKCPAPIVGVTGTKGKSTTTTLIGKMLEEAGARVLVGGNIGVPALDLLPDVTPQHVVVLELSSFQLIDLRYSPQVALCLPVTSDHLDWHRSQCEYVEAKSSLFRHQHAEDLAVWDDRDATSDTLAMLSPARKQPVGVNADWKNGRLDVRGVEICGREDVRLLGEHNLANIAAAAVVALELTDEPSAIRAAIRGFAGLEHRLEIIGEVDGVCFVNDSAATNPDAARAGIAAFNQSKILILGGSSKNAIDVDELASTVARSTVRRVLLVGDEADRLSKALSAAGFHDFTRSADNMDDIVSVARQFAAPGDVVLLSPGCASFGPFRNYVDRGSKFKAAVEASRTR